MSWVHQTRSAHLANCRGIHDIPPPIYLYSWFNIRVKNSRACSRNTLYNVCSVHLGMFSKSGGVQYIGGDIMVHVGEQVDKSLSISIENPDVLNIPRCTHDIPPTYSWYPPMYSWHLPDVLNIPRCTEHTLYSVRNKAPIIFIISDVTLRMRMST